MTAVMLANHRRIAPFGVAGGESGALGENWVERADGTREVYGATFKVEMGAGDVFVIRTPGGGGFGATSDAPHAHGPASLSARLADVGERLDARDARSGRQQHAAHTDQDRERAREQCPRREVAIAIVSPDTNAK
jgi:hypothetical protein